MIWQENEDQTRPGLITGHMGLTHSTVRQGITKVAVCSVKSGLFLTNSTAGERIGEPAECTPISSRSKICHEQSEKQVQTSG